MDQQSKVIKPTLQLPSVWTQLPAQQRQQLAKLIASLIRRLRQPVLKKDEARNE